MAPFKQIIERLAGLFRQPTTASPDVNLPDDALPPLVIHPYNKPTSWEAYLLAWSEAMKTEWGREIAAYTAQNYARALMQTCPSTLVTVEQRALWLAAQDAKKEVYGAYLTAATNNLALMRRPKPLLPNSPIS